MAAFSGVMSLYRKGDYPHGLKHSTTQEMFTDPPLMALLLVVSTVLNDFTFRFSSLRLLDFFIVVNV